MLYSQHKVLRPNQRMPTNVQRWACIGERGSGTTLAGAAAFNAHRWEMPEAKALVVGPEQARIVALDPSVIPHPGWFDYRRPSTPRPDGIDIAWHDVATIIGFASACESKAMIVIVSFSGGEPDDMERAYVIASNKGFTLSMLGNAESSGEYVRGLHASPLGHNDV